VRLFYIQIHPTDNVGIIVHEEGIRRGDEFAVESIPQSHKISLRDLAAGEPVLRYGYVIGYAKRAIPRGSWIREDLLEMPAAPALDEMPLATAVPPEPPPLSGYSFQGYRNADGSAGTRNILGITTTVQCVAPTVDFAVQRIRDEILPRFPNVDDVVALTHTYGCGVAIDAPGAQIPIRTIRNISRNPNIGGAPLTVSLGCEKMQPSRLFSSDLPVLEEGGVIRLQDERGFIETVAAIMRAAEKRLRELDDRRRTECPASDLVVGLQCGGIDAFSGVTCNPAVGAAADLLVRAGATVLFSEVTEVRDAAHLLTARAATRDVALDLVRELRWYDDYLARGLADRSANTTPGNKRGGLANIVEKSLGSVAKAGSTALRAVASHGEKVTTKGLVFAASPASDFICGTLQLASMNLHVFTTGEGSPYGLALAPVVKISSRTALAEKWPDLIDLDAGRIVTGGISVGDAGWELFRMLLEVAGGKKTWAERWHLHNALTMFNPGPVT